ncbi:hypothetical protein IG631_13989 [Alternaria alternata]|nr:hypothetical protein IG631_13989 [Alternaria alternata]
MVDFPLSPEPAGRVSKYSGSQAGATHPAAGSCTPAVTVASPPRACGQWPGCVSSARHRHCWCSCRCP